MAIGTHRRLAAIVSADVVGYSRLMSLDEEGTLNAVKSAREEVFDPQLINRSYNWLAIISIVDPVVVTCGLNDTGLASAQ